MINWDLQPVNILRCPRQKLQFSSKPHSLPGFGEKKMKIREFWINSQKYFLNVFRSSNMGLKKLINRESFNNFLSVELIETFEK